MRSVVDEERGSGIGFGGSEDARQVSDEEVEEPLLRNVLRMLQCISGK